MDSLTTKTTVEVIKKLKAHLARHGIPDQVISDNGQPFASHSFHEFASTYGFEHVTSESQDLPHAAPVQKPPAKPSVPSAQNKQNKQETSPSATTTLSRENGHDKAFLLFLYCLI